MDVGSSNLESDLDAQSVPLAMPARRPHSGAGIASTVAAVLSLAHMAGWFVTVVVLASNGKSAGELSTATWAAVFMSAWGLAFLSVGLGVGALNHPARRKLFSIIGTAAGCSRSWLGPP